MTSCLLSCIKSRSEKRTALKEKNLVPVGGKIFLKELSSLEVYQFALINEILLYYLTFKHAMHHARRKCEIRNIISTKGQYL